MNVQPAQKYHARIPFYSTLWKIRDYEVRCQEQRKVEGEVWRRIDTSMNVIKIRNHV